MNISAPERPVSRGHIGSRRDASALLDRGRWRLLSLSVAAASGMTACQSSRVVDQAIPTADEQLSLFGASRARFDFHALPVVRFEAGWREPRAEDMERLERAVRGIAAERPERRVLVVGVGDADIPLEHGRQQGMARATGVRRELIRRGVGVPVIWVTGVAASEAVLLTDREAAGPRVELAVVR